MSSMSVTFRFTVAYILCHLLFAETADVMDSGDATICRPIDCNHICEITFCYRGLCTDDGSCKCDPCYEGINCNQYRSHFTPTLQKSSDVISVNRNPMGVIYQVAAEDADYGEDCKTLGNRTCMCGNNIFRLSPTKGSENFIVNNMTGEINLKEGYTLDDDSQYNLKVFLIGMEEDTSEYSTIHGEFDLTVRVPLFEEFDILEQKTPSMNFQSLPPVSRRKRETSAAGLSTTLIDVQLIGADPAVLLPGYTLDFEVSITFPNIDSSSPTDLKIEIFASDFLAGVTTLALFGVEITHVGSMLKSGTTSSALQADEVSVNYHYNKDLTEIPDRAVVKLSSVYNDDTYNAAATGASLDPSTLKMKFSTTMIINEAFTADSVKVVVGIEYADGTYIQVSEGAIPYESAPTSLERSCNLSLILSGPDTVPQYSSALVTAKGPILIPYETVELEFYDLGTESDLYSIENVFVSRVGENTMKVPISLTTEDPTYFKSMSGKTYVRALYSFSILNSYITDYDAAVGTEFDYEISASIRIANAPVGSKIKVFANVKSHRVLWIASIEIEVTAEDKQPEGKPTTLTISGPDSTQVRSKESLSWLLDFGLAPDGNLISCTTNSPASAEIVGVSHGELGQYVAQIPDLSNSVDYEAGTWEFLVNTAILDTATSTFDPTKHKLQLVVTVYYSDADDLGDVVVSCKDGLTATLTATKNLSPDATNQPTMAIPSVPNVDWYEGSVMSFTSVITAKNTAVDNLYYQGSFDNSGPLQYQICDIRVQDVQKGVSAMLKAQATIDEISVNTTSGTLGYTSSIESHLGPLGTTAILSDDDAQNTFKITVYAKLPKEQSVPYTGTTTLESKLSNDGTQITVTTSSPVTIKDATQAPVANPVAVVFSLPLDASKEILSMQTIKIRVKTTPGSSAQYKVVAHNDGTNAVICNIVLLAVGRNFACVNTVPYDTSTDPTEIITALTDPTDPASTHTLDIGILTNHGSSSNIYAESIADSDTFEIGVFARQKTEADTSWSVALTLYSNDIIQETRTEVFSTTDAITPKVSSSLTVENVSEDFPVYEGIPTAIDVYITVPNEFNKKVTISIANTGISSQLSLCGFHVTKVGVNVPCLKTYLVDYTDEQLPDQKIIADLSTVCHYPITRGDPLENQITVQILVKLSEGETGVNVPLVINEDGQESTHSLSLVKSTDPVPSVNLTGANMTLMPMETYTGVPGERIWVSMNTTIPVGIYAPMKLTVLTNTSDGHAEATIHGFKFGSFIGENIGCMEPLDPSAINITQGDVSDGVPFIHASQNNILTVDLGAIPNQGRTYYLQTHKIEDDTIVLEAEIMVADHSSLADGDTLNVYFVISFEEEIFVVNFAEVTVNKSVPLQPTILSEFTLDQAGTILQPKSKMNFGIKLWHSMNESNVEIYEATARVCSPKFIHHVNDADTGYTTDLVVDTYSSNEIAVITKGVCLDFNVNNIFFTDLISLNFSVTVDPYGDIPYGLGTLDMTSVFKLVGRKSSADSALELLNPVSYTNYKVISSDCEEDLNIAEFCDDQFSGSITIHESFAPHLASKTDGPGWIPAAISSSWQQYISIDMLRKARISTVEFIPVDGKRSVKTYKLQRSQNGRDFVDVCQQSIEANEGLLPLECRFESRHVRLVVLAASDFDISNSIAVKFKWYGCYMEAAGATCPVNPPQTIFTSNIRDWRHMLENSDSEQLYLCDTRPQDMQLHCFMINSTGVTILPSYIRGLSGVSKAEKKVFAYTSNSSVLVSSVDGSKWSPVPDAKIPGTYDVQPIVLPADPLSSFKEVKLENWNGQYCGLFNDDTNNFCENSYSF